MSGAIDAQALGDLMDGDDGGFAAAIAQLEHDLEQKDDLARRLLDQCRYQHLVLTEINDLLGICCYSNPQSIQSVHAKARAALNAATKSGLLA